MKKMPLLVALALTLCLFGCQPEGSLPSSSSFDHKTSDGLDSVSSQTENLGENNVSSGTVSLGLSEEESSVSSDAGFEVTASSPSNVFIRFDDDIMLINPGTSKTIRPTLSRTPVKHTYRYQAETEPEGMIEFEQVDTDGRMCITGKQPGLCKLKVTVTCDEFDEKAQDDLLILVPGEELQPETGADIRFNGGVSLIKAGETREIGVEVSSAVKETDYHFEARTEPEGIAEFTQREKDILEPGYREDDKLVTYITGKKAGVCKLSVKAVFQVADLFF